MRLLRHLRYSSVWRYGVSGNGTVRIFIRICYANPGTRLYGAVPSPGTVLPVCFTPNGDKGYGINTALCCVRYWSRAMVLRLPYAVCGIGQGLWCYDCPMRCAVLTKGYGATTALCGVWY
eukprot:3933615-Rhodomonas_salina.1